jgi:TonB family protein
VTVRVVAASAAIHGVLVVVLVLAAGGRAQRAPVVDIELVAPAAVVLAATPALPPERGRDLGPRGGDRIADRAPGHRALPARNPLPVHRAAVPAPSLAPAALAAPAVPATPPAEPAAPQATETGESEPAAGGRQGGGGAGEGAGGGGDGDGMGAIDRSARPVPLEPSAAQTSMYTAEALRDRVSGDVQLVLMVDPLGHVGSATVRRGLGHGLDEIATRLAMQIRFRPARDRAGKPTTGTVRWRFHFQPP